MPDEEVLREPEWSRVKVDQMTAGMDELRRACAQTREVVDREVPQIRARRDRAEAERARLRGVVEAAAGMLAHFEALLQSSHPQLRAVPEVAAKMDGVRAAVAAATAALGEEIDLTGPVETDASLAALGERSDAALALAKGLALRLEVHAAELEARVRREALRRQKLNRDRMPTVRATLAELETTLAAAHPQLSRVESVSSNVAEFVARFNALQADLRACVDVTSQPAMDTALQGLDARCGDVGDEAAFVLTLVKDEETALMQRLADYEALRTELEDSLMFAGVKHYEAAVAIFNDGPEQLRAGGSDGAAALLLADGAARVDAAVEAWKAVPDLTPTEPAATAATAAAFRAQGEAFRDGMAALEAQLARLTADMRRRIAAETQLRADIDEKSLGAARSHVASIGAALRAHPHMQDEGHHVTQALRVLAALALHTEERLQSIAVDVTSDEAMAGDMAQLRAHADELDAARHAAQQALDAEHALVAARRKVVVDGVEEVRGTLLQRLRDRQRNVEVRLDDAPPKFAEVPHVVELQREVAALVARAQGRVDGLAALAAADDAAGDKGDGDDGGGTVDSVVADDDEDGAAAGEAEAVAEGAGTPPTGAPLTAAALVADDDAGVAALAELRQELGPLDVRCAEVEMQLDTELARLLERQAEDARRRADLRGARLGPAELVMAEVRQSLEEGGERLRADDEVNKAVSAAAASVAKCDHLLQRRMDYTTAESLEEDFQKLLKDLARENTVERCEEARRLVEALVARVRAADSTFWTGAAVLGKMRRRAARARFTLKVGGWRKNRVAAADALRKALQERGERLRAHPNFADLVNDHATNDGEAAPGGKEMTLALAQAGDGAAAHWASVDALRGAAVAALATKFERISAAGEEPLAETDAEEEEAAAEAAQQQHQQQQAAALARIDGEVAALEAALKHTKNRFDGLEKRLAAAAQRGLKALAADVSREEAEARAAQQTAAKAALQSAAAGAAEQQQQQQQTGADDDRDTTAAAEVAAAAAAAAVAATLRQDEVAVAAAADIQQLFRDRRARTVLAESHFADGAVHDVDPEIMAIVEHFDDTTLDQQARVAYAWDTPGFVRTVTIERGDDWATQSLGLQAELPPQYDLTYRGYEMRISDPYLRLKGLDPGSCFEGYGIRPEDAVLTVNGKDFDTVAEFAALAKERRSIVLQVAHMPDTPAWAESDTAGAEVLARYKKKVRNAVAMRVGHEVRVNDAYEAAHANEEDPPERHIPELHTAKVRGLECLLAFLVVQDLARQAAASPAPLLCAAATAAEDAGLLPRASRRTVGKYCTPDPQAWLAAQLDAWRKGQRRRGGVVAQTRGGPTQAFRDSYATFALQYPKDYGRRVAAAAAADAGGTSGGGADDAAAAAGSGVGGEDAVGGAAADGEGERAGEGNDGGEGGKKNKKKGTRRGVRQGPRPEGQSGESWDVLHGVEGLVKTASGRYIKP